MGAAAVGGSGAEAGLNEATEEAADKEADDDAQDALLLLPSALDPGTPCPIEASFELKVKTTLAC